MSTDTVSPLRQRMMDDMNARKLGAHSQRSHISSCKRFAAGHFSRVASAETGPFRSCCLCADGAASGLRRCGPEPETNTIYVSRVDAGSRTRAARSD